MRHSILTALLILGTLAPFTAKADCDEIARKCWNTGFEKVLSQAQSFKCEMNVESFGVSETDCRFYNPSKYVWYAAEATCAKGEKKVIQKLVQHAGGECF